MTTAPQKKVTLEQAIAIARKSHKQGKSGEAQAILTQILKAQPKNLPALVAVGDILFDRRQFLPAAQAYGRAAQLAPKNPQLLLQLGNALQSAGRSADALKAFSAVLKLKPDHSVAMNNVGNALQSLKQYDNAVRAYLQSLKIQPKQTLANYNLGVLLMKAGKFPQAAQYLSNAVKLDGKHIPALHNLGIVLQRLRKTAEAETMFRQAIKLRPKYAPALLSLGVLLAETGRLQDALVTLRSASQFAPRNPQIAFVTGNVLRALGKTDEGANELAKALKLNPRHVDARLGLAGVLAQKDKTREATTLLFAGLTLTPNNIPLRRAAVSALRELTVSNMSPQGRRILLSMINDPTISTQEIARVVINLVRGAAYFKPLLDAAKAGEDLLATQTAAARQIMGDALLSAALPRMLVCDGEVEAILTALRRAFLLRATAGEFPLKAAEGVNGAFLSALARQGFASEYALYVQPDEQQKIDALKAQIEELLASGLFTPNKLEWSLGIYALYAPISSLKGWEKILGTSLSSWSPPLALIIREQVFEKERENEVARSIPSITPIQDATSQQFLKLYDANPYPRWRSLSHPIPEAIEAFSRRLRPSDPPVTFPRPTPVLVAGCGTGHHPIQVALRFPQAQVTALDISPVALAYGARMAERFNVGSILWRQGDLLELGKIEDKYAVIECGGVLHHVKDPAAAIAILRDRLLPGGLLKIGVYSAIARSHVEPARKFVQTQGFGTDPAGIRDARKALLAMPDKSPERDVLASSDFYATSGCRFLAYPIEEHTFTLPQIAGILEQLGLRFLAFDLAPRFYNKFRAANPAPEALTDLAAWAKFEESEPLTFRKMYQFWVCAK